MNLTMNTDRAKEVALTAVEVVRICGNELAIRTDMLAVEEPLEIRLGCDVAGKRVHRAVSITMRTPGHDQELAVGFLFTEGIIVAREQVAGRGQLWCGQRSTREFTARHRGRPIAAGAALLRIVKLRSVRQSFARGGAGCTRAIDLPKGRPVVDAACHSPTAGDTAGGTSGVRPHRRSARCGSVQRRRRFVVSPRGCRPTQRTGQADRRSIPCRAHAPFADACCSSAGESASSSCRRRRSPGFQFWRRSALRRALQ